MQKFDVLTGVAAPLNMENVDTDKIIPARFLKTIKRTGLGVHLFAALRYEDDGSEKAGFCVEPAEISGHAEILVTGDNFGCGSSREHAPWALLDFGIRCIISRRALRIFFMVIASRMEFCRLSLPQAICEQLMADAALGTNARITVDLARQVVVRPDGAGNWVRGRCIQETLFVERVWMISG